MGQAINFEPAHPVCPDSTTTVPRPRVLSWYSPSTPPISSFIVLAHSVRIRRAYDHKQRNSAPIVELSQFIYVSFAGALAYSMPTLHAWHRCLSACARTPSAFAPLQPPCRLSSADPLKIVFILYSFLWNYEYNISFEVSWISYGKRQNK